MVLGLKSKSRKSHSVHAEYKILLKEVKPWPQSLASAQTITLQWENDDNGSGSFTASVTDDILVYDELLTLSFLLIREESKRGSDHERFQKNNMEFFFYKARKEKLKPVGSAVINLADYGIITESVTISAPINLKKNPKNAPQPYLYVNIWSADNISHGSSPKTSFSKLLALDNEGSGSASVASFTDDDDISSNSSRKFSFSASETSKGSPGQNQKVSKSMQKTLSLGPNHVNDSPAPVASSGEQGYMIFGGPRIEAENERKSRTFNKHSADEATLVSEIERLLREEERLRQQSSVDLIFEELRNNQKQEKAAKKDDDMEDKGLLEGSHSFGRQPVVELPPDAVKKQMKLRTNTLNLSRKPTFGGQGGSTLSNKLRHLNSVQLRFDSGENKKAEKTASHGKGTSESTKIEMLEQELREAAALEAAIYSVVAEHGKSVNKVHTPARRLSRFYLHACKAGCEFGRARVARAAVSGLILVSKACGNDVPRLTFWLSNSTVLRGMVSQDIAKLNFPPGTVATTNKGGKLKGSKKESYNEWEEPRTFLAALEKFEAWIFSRIVKSVWWQALTPHMQSAIAQGSSSKKNNGKKRSSGQNQGLASIELWKKAFQDACQRICPLRATGCECGCLPVLMKLILEQLVNRLDVAMFNAILRKSADDMPTDPVSDPISDPNVLPVPLGKASFGAGAKLKNAIGSWSRWFADMFDGDDGGSPEEKKDDNGGDMSTKPGTSYRAFYLLNALGDLMMLPFEMLADRSTRKEVCPMFGAPIVKRVLDNFVPDEFNPGKIPKRIFEALESEEVTHAEDGSITSSPCLASPTSYSPPPASLITSFIGDVGSQPLSRSGSALVRKSYTSDDELNELDTALTSILIDTSRASFVSEAPKGKGERKVVRYQLLREVWRDSEL